MHARMNGMEISYVTRITRYIEYISPKGTRVSNSSSHDHILRKGPSGGFSLSRFARIPRTKSPPRSTERSLFPLPPFLPFLFPSLSLFSPFSKKSPSERRARRKEGAEGEGRNNMRWGGREAACKHRPARFHG